MGKTNKGRYKVYSMTIITVFGRMLGLAAKTKTKPRYATYVRARWKGVSVKDVPEGHLTTMSFVAKSKKSFAKRLKAKGFQMTKQPQLKGAFLVKKRGVKKAHKMGYGSPRITWWRSKRSTIENLKWPKGGTKYSIMTSKTGRKTVSIKDI